MDLLDEEGRNADDFLACSKFMIDTLLADEKNPRSNLKDMMKGIMKGVLCKDAKKQGELRSTKLDMLRRTQMN